MLIKVASLLIPQVIVFTPIITSVVIAVVGAARVARQPEKRSEIAYVHGSLLLLLSFLVLPATSMKILRVLTPCFKLKTNGVLLHYVRGGLFVGGGSDALRNATIAFSQADLSIDCDSARFVEAKTIAFLMIAIYPVGIPLVYACLLFCFRRLINPLGCDELTAMRVRRELTDTNPRLRAIEFLFSCYRPGAYGFEVFESVRRIAMTGLIRYVKKKSGPPVTGILFSLVSIIVFREIQPYENPSTNALSTFAQVESNESTPIDSTRYANPVCAVATSIYLPAGLCVAVRTQLGAREQTCTRRNIAAFGEQV